MVNQGLLEVNFNIKNNINLNNAFSSENVKNPLLKSISGNISAKDANSLENLAGGNTALQHIDTIRTNSSNTSLKEALNNLPNLKYVRLEGNYESKGNSFDNNTNLQKVDLSESLQVKPEDFKANENLKTLPKLDYSNPDLTDIITNDTNLLPTTFDISNEPNTNKLGIHGDSTHQLGNLEFVKVNPEAPFDGTIPQIDTSYTSLNQNGLVNLFNTLPYNVGYQIIGNPTIVDGIASGFSGNDYLTLPSITNDFIKKLNQSSEIGIKLTTPTEEISQYAVQAFFIPYSGTASGFSFYKDGKKIRWIITPGYYIDTPSFNDGETVWLKGIRNNGTAELLYSTNGTSYISAGTLDISNIEDPSASGNNAIPKIGINGDIASGWKYTGSIDLNNTYIKINSQVSTGPVGYTVVGSPTIVDGVVNGFSSSNYLRTTYFPFASLLNFEVKSKFVTPSVAPTSTQCIVGTSSYYSAWGFILLASMKVIGRIYINIDGTSASYDLTTDTLALNTTYYVRMNFDVGTGIQTLSISTDNENWTTINATRSGTTITVPDPGYWQVGKSQSSPFEGSIDLNETYIKVNGKLWFGHESKQVTWFKGLPATPKVIKILGSTGESSLTNDDRAIATNKGWYINEETVYNSFPEDLPINF